MKKATFFIIICLFSSMVLVNAFYITDNFNDNDIDSTIWFNRSNNDTSTAYEVGGVALINGSYDYFGGDYRFPLFQTKQAAQKNQNVTITFNGRVRQLSLTAEQNFFMLSDWANGQSPQGFVGNSYCGLTFWHQNLENYKVYKSDNDAFDLVHDFDIDDNLSHAFYMKAERVFNGTTNYTKYTLEVDGTPFTYEQNHPNCINDNQPILNFTFQGVRKSSYTEAEIDNFIMQLDSVPTCVEPCLLNETFTYVDSICSHDWISGECSDLNTPVDYKYICNGSDEIIAYYFGALTKKSGIIEFTYDLQINSDYEVLIGFADTSGSLALAYYYDGGTIYDLRDNTNITTYDFNTTYTYKIQIDLQNQMYDFYKDNLLKNNDLPFYTNVENLYYFFIQPDYLQGSPYCDFELDNVQLSKQIAVIPESNETLTIGSYWNLNPNNAGFNEDLACKENEHPTLCVYRATFEDLGGRFTNFVFNNFLLFMVLVLIIIIMILFKKHY